MRHRIAIAALLACTCGLPACSGIRAEPGAGRAYPEFLARDEPLDIQVFRDETQITITNTTASSYGACWIWINAWYGRSIDGLEIGEEITLKLNSFKDEYGEAFRAGGFFAAERSEALVLAELETTQTDDAGGTTTILKPLIVVNEIE